MQFKAHVAKDGARSWSLVRWEYDANKGRSRPINLGAVTAAQLRSASRASQLDITSRLSPDERNELDEFWKAARPAVMRDVYARTFRMTLYELREAVEAIDAGAATPQVAEQLWLAIDRVSASLRKGGLPRQKSAKTKAGERASEPLEPTPTEAARTPAARAMVLVKAAEVFGSEAEGEAWMERPAIGLEQQRPIDLMTTPEGLETVMVFLGRLERDVYT